MGKRQKLILLLYAFAVFIVSFVYVPYVSSWQGNKTSLGHHLRATIGNFLGIQWKSGLKDASGNIISVSIDSSLIVAEIIGLTAITVAGILFLQKREKPTIRLEGPF